MEKLVMENVASKTRMGTDSLTDSQMDHVIFLERCYKYSFHLETKI